MSDTKSPQAEESGKNVTAKPFPPRVWIRKVDVDDIVQCGDGCEADVQTLYSPRSVIVTGMIHVMSVEEHEHLIAEERSMIERLNNGLKTTSENNHAIRARLARAEGLLQTCDETLEDYVETLERKTGARLYHGKNVINGIRAYFVQGEK